VSKHSGHIPKLRYVGVNVRLAHETRSVMALRYLHAASRLPRFHSWDWGQPTVQLGSLEPDGGYLRFLEGGHVGYVPANDPTGPIFRLKDKVDVLAIDAPVDPSNPAETGEKLREMRDAAKSVGAKPILFLCHSGQKATAEQYKLISSLVYSYVLVSEVKEPRLNVLEEYRKRHSFPVIPDDYLDQGNFPLYKYVTDIRDQDDNWYRTGMKGAVYQLCVHPTFSEILGGLIDSRIKKGLPIDE